MRQDTEYVHVPAAYQYQCGVGNKSRLFILQSLSKGWNLAIVEVNGTFSMDCSRVRVLAEAPTAGSCEQPPSPLWKWRHESPHSCGDRGLCRAVGCRGWSLEAAVGGREEHAAEQATPGVASLSSCSSCCLDKQTIFVYNSDRNENFHLACLKLQYLTIFYNRNMLSFWVFQV